MEENLEKIMKFTVSAALAGREKNVEEMLKNGFAKLVGGKLSVVDFARLSAQLLPLIQPHQVNAVKAHLSKLSGPSSAPQQKSALKPKTVYNSRKKDLPKKSGAW